MGRYAAIVAGVFIVVGAAMAAPEHHAEFVFDPGAQSHGHVHASCIVVCPNGDLRAVWYENGPSLPSPPYYEERQDKADNVRIGGARKPAGATAWEAPFVMTDTFGVSDNNPCMVVDDAGRLWLIYPTLMGVPEWTWASALLRYRVADTFDHPGAPKWTTSNILVPHIPGIREVIDQTLDELAATEAGAAMAGRLRAEVEKAYENPLIERLGWMPRAHPLVRSDGAVVVPLSNENFSVACMAITKDGGASWTFSKPVPEAGLTQPTLVELKDGTIVAFFRNDSPEHRIKRSESTDGGVTWGPITLTDLPHPGAGIEAIMLDSGHMAIVYNDVEDSPRDKLAVSISDDNGATWKWTRHLEDTPDGRFDYPSMVQAPDGTIHVTYSYNLETVKHAWFNEEWVQAGD